MIYGGDISYSTWRGAISDVLFGKNVSKLADATQVIIIMNPIVQELCTVCV